MFKKYSFTFLLILLIFFFHQSAILAINWRLNFLPAILVFVLFAFNKNLALFWSISLGFLLDVYSALPFGSHLISLYLILLAVFFLAKNFITNRSYLSLTILTILATLLNNLFLYLIQKIILLSSVPNKLIIINWQIVFIQIISNLILISIIFYITYKFTTRLKTDSIITK
jgi:rod shape-determining protein MreD